MKAPGQVLGGLSAFAMQRELSVIGIGDQELLQFFLQLLWRGLGRGGGGASRYAVQLRFGELASLRGVIQIADLRAIVRAVADHDASPSRDLLRFLDSTPGSHPGRRI